MLLRKSALIIVLLNLNSAVNSYVISNNSSSCGPHSDYREPNLCVCHEGFKADSTGLCQPIEVSCSHCDNGICVALDQCECLPDYEKNHQIVEDDEIIDICGPKSSTERPEHNELKCLADCDCWNELDELGNVIDPKTCLAPCSGHFDKPCLNTTDCRCDVQSNRLLCDYLHAFTATSLACNRHFYNLHVVMATILLTGLVLGLLTSLVFKLSQWRRSSKHELLREENDSCSEESKL